MQPDTDGLAKLREEFPPNQISKLPKETRSQIDARKENKNLLVWKCDVCGGTHHKDAVHLDYVGHAALTDRLLDVDPLWSWEPVGFTPDGLPALDRNNGLWIKLTVCGVTRFGYGAADGKQGGDAIKEIIGDALRNAAMRFGAALDLWHKGDLHADEQEDAKPVQKPEPQQESIEPPEGWVAWGAAVQEELTKAKKPHDVEAIRQREDARIRAVGPIDKTIYQALGKAFNAARDRFNPEKKAA